MLRHLTLELSVSRLREDELWVKPPVGVLMLGFTDGSEGKESAHNTGDPGSSPGLRRSPGGGHGNPLQYSCLENSMDRGAWWVTVHGVIAQSQAQLSN